MRPLWAYRPRPGSYNALDERARIVFAVCGVAAALSTFRPAALAVTLAAAVSVVLAARVSLRELRRFLLFALLLVGLLVGLTFLTRGGTLAERRLHALAQGLRMFSLVGFTCVLPFTLDPARLGLTFRRLGLPDRLAFAVELAFRFVPTLTSRFERTLRAQSARGLELDPRGASLPQRLRNLVPLWVPVLLDAVIAGEDLADAMDLRGFGTEPRTWSGTSRWGTGEALFALAGAGLLALVLAWGAVFAV